MREQYQPQLNLAASKRRFLLRAYADSLKVGGCVDCGNKNLTVLQFDHVRETKTRVVSKMVQGSFETLEKEIAKCEVRCANCHMIVTQKRIKKVKAAVPVEKDAASFVIPA